jgi:hypothetical protein
MPEELLAMAKRNVKNWEVKTENWELKNNLSS